MCIVYKGEILLVHVCHSLDQCLRTQKSSSGAWAWIGLRILIFRYFIWSPFWFDLSVNVSVYNGFFFSKLPFYNTFPLHYERHTLTHSGSCYNALFWNVNINRASNKQTIQKGNALEKQERAKQKEFVLEILRGRWYLISYPGKKINYKMVTGIHINSFIWT